MSEFNESQEYLLSAKQFLETRDQMEDELDKLHSQQKKMSKSVASEEKSIADELAQTIKKRRQEITDTYDDRLDDNRSRKKSVSNKRDKKKNQRMNARIDDETKDTREKIKDLEGEMKSLLKREKVSSFVSSKAFFTMFLPRGLGETVVTLVCWLVYFIGVPSVFRLLVRNSMKNSNKNIGFWGNLVFVLVFILLAVIYFAIYNATVRRNNDVVKQARKIQDQIKSSKHQVKDIKKSISKDKDESQYNLDAYDEKLANLDAEAEAINAEKVEKLREFEEETVQVITDEINNRRVPVLEQMKADQQALDSEVSDKEVAYNNHLSQIAEQFTSRIGEDLFKRDRLDNLLSIMEEGRATTVTEAIEVYRAPKSSK